MRTIPLIALGLILGAPAAASNLDKLAARPVKLVIESHRPAAGFAQCVRRSLNGHNDIEGSGSSWTVIRYSGENLAYAQWEFEDLPGGGSSAKLKTRHFNHSGHDKVRICANQ